MGSCCKIQTEGCPAAQPSWPGTVDIAPPRTFPCCFHLEESFAPSPISLLRPSLFCWPRTFQVRGVPCLARTGGSFVFAFTRCRPVKKVPSKLRHSSAYSRAPKAAGPSRLFCMHPYPLYLVTMTKPRSIHYTHLLPQVCYMLPRTDRIPSCSRDDGMF